MADRPSGVEMIGLGVIASVLLAGCANVLQAAPPASTDTGSGVGGPGSSAYEHNTGADDVLVSISGPNGATSLESAATHTTEFLLLGDGTAIVPGVIDLVYPGPAIYPLQSATLREQQIQEFFSAADQAGLLGGMVDFGSPAVADMASTNVAINVNGQSYWQSAFAFGAGLDSGLSESQQQARAALELFIETARGLVGPDSQQCEPSAVTAVRRSPDAFPSGDEPDLEQSPRRWPIASVPTVPATSSSGMGTCVVVTGAEVPTLLAALAEANALTAWLIGNDPPVRIEFRPQLPGDPGCDR